MLQHPRATALPIRRSGARPRFPPVFITRMNMWRSSRSRSPRTWWIQPIKATVVPGGKASVAMLHRVEAGGECPDPRPRHRDLLHPLRVGHDRDGWIAGYAQADGLTRVNAGMSQTGTRIGGESRKVKPATSSLSPPHAAQLQRARRPDQLPRVSASNPARSRPTLPGMRWRRGKRRGLVAEDRPVPPLGTTHSAEPVMPRYNSTASSTG